jgi:hypothetical protein
LSGAGIWNKFWELLPSEWEDVARYKDCDGKPIRVPAVHIKDAGITSLTDTVLISPYRTGTPSSVLLENKHIEPAEFHSIDTIHLRSIRCLFFAGSEETVGKSYFERRVDGRPGHMPNPEETPISRTV